MARAGGCGQDAPAWLSRRAQEGDTAEPGPDRSWWSTLPGILTGLAALLTAVTGALALLLPVLRGPAGAEPPGPPPQIVPAAPLPAPAGLPGAPPLRLGERLEVAGTIFEVLGIETTTPRGELRDIRVTFRATAGATAIDLARSNVRILTPGRILTPREGLPATRLPAGSGRQFQVRFEVEGGLVDPVLSFTDDMFAPRGEVRRALPGF